MHFAAPIGISDFRKLRAQGRSYVDKTGCIARMLAAPAEVLRFPRPRRFGKTLLLSTLQAFVERGSDDRSDLFAGLAIWDDEDARRHLARYPVISLTFKDVKYETWPKCLAAVSRSLARIVQSQGALRPALTGMEGRTFDALLGQSDDEGLLADSLAFLAGILPARRGVAAHSQSRGTRPVSDHGARVAGERPGHRERRGRAPRRPARGPRRARGGRARAPAHRPRVLSRLAPDARGADPVHVYAAVFDQKRAYVRTAAPMQPTC